MVSETQSKAVANALRQKIQQEAPNAWIIPRRINIEVDGDLSDWEGITPFEIKDGDKTAAYVYAAWSPRGLFMAYDIRSEMPWKTSAEGRSVFQGGPAADVNIGPLEPQRTEGIQGDYRVLFSPHLPQGFHGEHPIITIMLPKMPAGLDWGELKPETYKTDSGEVTFADVRWHYFHGGRYAIKKREGMGPVIEVSLPTYEPFKLEKGYRFKMEASLMLSNEEGTKSIARLPWRSIDPQDRVVTDLCIEAALRPQNWGEAILE